jgi:hypothetical protein
MEVFVEKSIIKCMFLTGKSTINGSVYRKIHYKWMFLWENPL